MADATRTAKPRKAASATKDGSKPARVSQKARAEAERAAAAQQVLSNLGALKPLAEFMLTTGALGPADRDLIVDQALLMLGEYYVHLPLKRAMHAVDPLQRLKLLKQHRDSLSEREFLDEMISIYQELRDLHTNFILPAPYNQYTASVPFRIEEFWENNTRQYMVTQVAATVSDPHLKPGVIVTHWNNIPIERAVEINAQREGGSNLAARHAMGLLLLTQRPMMMSLPPDEEKVDLRYTTPDGKAYETACDWIVFQPNQAPQDANLISGVGPLAHGLGVDLKTEIARRGLKLLFSPESIAAERATKDLDAEAIAAGVAAAPAAVDLGKTSTMPDIFSYFGPQPTPSGTFGYVRLRSFNVADVGAFLNEFLRIIRLLPQNGLIIDVRQNGGGVIAAGECLLQLLTPRHIEPERFAFLNTGQTLALCRSNASFAAWTASINQSVELGSQFSQSFPLTLPDDCNVFGQQYQGPVVLITDALCYSTTDMFAAGFQDHGIGKILGVDASTGAGGANVWTHEAFQQLFAVAPDSPFRYLPNGASFRVALRRAIRVGSHDGVPLEDLGVIPDELHQMTRADVTSHNVDLIAHAGRLLAKMPGYHLAALATNHTPTTVHLDISSQNVTRIDVFVNDRPRASLDVPADAATSALDLPAPANAQIDLRGYASDVLAVASRLWV